MHHHRHFQKVLVGCPHICHICFMGRTPYSITVTTITMITVTSHTLRASFEPQASIKPRAPFALRASCVNNGNFIGFLSKSTRPRPQWPIWLILEKNPYFLAWFSKTSAPHRRLRFWVLSLRITGNQQNALWGRTLEDTWNFVQYCKIQGKLVV